MTCYRGPNISSVPAVSYRYHPRDVDLMERTLAVLHAKVVDSAVWDHHDKVVQHLETKRVSPSEALAKELWSLNKAISAPQLRRDIATRTAHIRNDIDGGVWKADPQVTVEKLRYDGLQPLPPLLTRAQAAEAVAFIREAPATSAEHLLHYAVGDIVRAPHLMRAALEPAVLATASAYLGAPATVVDLALFQSPPGGDEPGGAQIFHRDRDDFRFCKLFIYLTDVDADRGPHIYVKGSHERDELARRRHIQVPEVLESLFVKSGRHLDRYVADLFKPDIIEIVGAAGFSFIEDTYGFHRGKIPVAGTRIIFSALYGIVPYFLRVQHMAQAAGVFDGSTLGDAQRWAARLLLADDEHAPRGSAQDDIKKAESSS
jgi:hypothetical protein